MAALCAFPRDALTGKSHTHTDTRKCVPGQDSTYTPPTLVTVAYS